MAIENERKFLVASGEWRPLVAHVLALRQGYLATAPDRSVRVRVDQRTAWLTLKFGASGPVREEFEYPIPIEDADAMLAHATGVVTKNRHIVPWQGLTFEVDVFAGPLDGLVLAELELAEPPADLPLPGWLGREVTGDPRYYNAVLARDGLPETAS